MFIIPKVTLYYRFRLNKQQGETVMKKNVGGFDKTARIVIGIVLIGLAATGQIGVWGYIGVIPLATGFLGWCPAYLPFGIKTCCSSDSCKK